MKDFECDCCGNELGKVYLVDNDLLLCPECFITTYKEAIEERIGVVVIGVKEESNEVEELEELLKKKLDRDEEWEELEIKSVKAIKESLGKDER